MALSIKTFILGPIENNTYLLSNSDSKEAVLIDPAVPSRNIINHLKENGLLLKSIWITHAHFDHIGGVRWLLDNSGADVKVVIHQEAISLWEIGGSAREFGFDFDPGPVPETIVKEGDRLSIGNYEFMVYHTPGHTPGHITFYCKEENMAFCGDLIFYHSIGRTDLTTSNESDLLNSINENIFTLPDETTLYPGHGNSTTVGEEKRNNPFV